AVGNALEAAGLGYGAAKLTTSLAPSLNKISFMGNNQVIARQTLAREFYSSTTEWSDARIAAHMKGIDFNKPVKVKTISQNTQLVQH
ncbi:hypothetical protein, partial [Klebsiella pneumoniae]|uniref:hypothetical protein n=1 Tax=Klebsiella pneumoniae TaxID=573 RepID=UPI0022B6EFF5